MNSKTMAFQDCKSKGVNFKTESQQESSQFVRVYRTKRVMMNQSLLHFLDLEDVFKLSMTCKSLRLGIDPFACTVDDGQTQKRNGSFHLKMIT